MDSDKRKDTIILIGPMGVGKSTVAQALAQRLQLPQCPLDQMAHYYYFKEGYDINQAKELEANEGFLAFVQHCQPFYVAAVRGFALGGGCELATACHLRVATNKARFGQPEVNLGLIPGFGGTQRLARVIGEGRALELILTGQMIDAATAHGWGLVNRVTEESALDSARQLAGEILGKGPLAVGLAIDAVRIGGSMAIDDALEFEAALFGVAFATEDMKEGTSAFLEKRAASFRRR